MKAVHHSKATCFLWFWLVIIWCGLTLSACAHIPGDQPARDQSQNHESVWHDWEEGMAAFQRGDYQGAQRYFEVVSKRALNEDLRRKGLYGLVCTRLLMAQTADDYNAALNLWGLWIRLAPSELVDEDPRMLALLLPRLYPTELTNMSLVPQVVLPSSLRSSDAPVVKVVKNKECEKQLRESDREVQRLKRQIRTLRLQIEALEAIHRKIQEKKKEVSSP
jgi:hypothetical protein